MIYTKNLKISIQLSIQVAGGLLALGTFMLRNIRDDFKNQHSYHIVKLNRLRSQLLIIYTR